MTSMNEPDTLRHTKPDTRAGEPRPWRQVALTGLLVAATSLLGACGSNPVAESDYMRAEATIAEAQEVDADELAAAELHQAQKKLRDARSADDKGDRENALRLLREAEVHAELAEVRSMARTRQQSLDEVQAGLDTLRRELEK